jgi:hypothetical protein
MLVEIERSTVRSATKHNPALSAKRRLLLGGSTLLFLLLSAGLIIRQYRPPEALAVDAPLTEFSAGRAIEHLQTIAREPHPLGSAAHDRVRDYIAQALSQLNLAPQVQAAEMRRSKGEPAVLVQNVLARLGGQAPDGEAIMLVAHYDSAPFSYGASDDGAGVVTLLETLRALTAEPPLKKDVIALFTDGEEVGLVGATAFVEQHPWAKGVGVVLNFEARGSRGPAFMFETSAGNGILIEEFARAAPHPFASSAASLIYENLANHTDLTVFKKAGYGGLNFAFIGAASDYHNENDCLERIDARSVQHHGSYALALARQFGNLATADLRAGDRVYFDVLGRAVVSYSQAFARLLTACEAVLFAAIAVYGLKTGRLSVGGMAVGASAFILSCIAAVIAAMAAQEALGFKHAAADVVRNEYLYAVFLFGLTFLIASVCYLYFNKWWNWEDLSSGTLVVMLVALGLMTTYFVGATYLLAWPFLFGSAGLALTVLRGPRIAYQPVPFVGVCLGSLPALVVLLWAAASVYQVVSLFHPLVLITVALLLAGFLVPLLKYLRLGSPFAR